MTVEFSFQASLIHHHLYCLHLVSKFEAEYAGGGHLGLNSHSCHRHKLISSDVRGRVWELHVSCFIGQDPAVWQQHMPPIPEMKFAIPQWGSNTPAIAFRTFSELPRIMKPTASTLNRMYLSDARGGDWSPIILCLDETMKNGPGWWHVNIGVGNAPTVPGSYLIQFPLRW